MEGYSMAEASAASEDHPSSHGTRNSLCKITKREFGGMSLEATTISPTTATTGSYGKCCVAEGRNSVGGGRSKHRSILIQ